MIKQTHQNVMRLQHLQCSTVAFHYCHRHFTPFSPFCVFMFMFISKMFNHNQHVCWSVKFPTCIGEVKVMVKESLNRPGMAQRVPGGLGSQIFMTFGTWRWYGRQPHASAAFTPKGKFLLLIFTRGWVDPRVKVRSEGICHWKIWWHFRESIPGPSD